MTSETIEERIKCLEDRDEANVAAHAEIIKKVDEQTKLIKPMSETFDTIRILGKWVAAVVVFFGVLGGAIWTFINIFDRFKK